MMKIVNMNIGYIRLIVSVGLLIFLSKPPAQAQGIADDEIEGDTIPELQLLVTEKGHFTKSAISLKKYCPIPYNQGKTNSCTAFAFCYGAFTIKESIKNGLSDQNEITRRAYSAAFMFNGLGIKDGISPKQARDFIEKYGFCLEKHFKNSNIHNLAVKMNDEKILNEAKQKIRGININKITGNDVKQTIKEALSNFMPVVIRAKIDDNFEDIRKPNWIPKLSGKRSHAMVIVGFDDKEKTFEIMNSHGVEWGQGGFIKLSYDFFEQVYEIAYTLNPLINGKGNDTDTSAYSPPPQKDTIAHFELKKEIKTRVNGYDQYASESVDVTYNSDKHYYETKERFGVNSTFRIVASHVPQNKKIYLFSLDANDSVSDYGIFNAQNDSTNFEMPSKNRVVRIESTEQMVVLIADKELADFDKRFDKFKEAKGDANARLKKAFGDILVETEQIDFNCIENSLEIKCLPIQNRIQHVVPVVFAVKIRKN
ncbi:MAG: C1 family peptidase [Saprospiraceae bacterium]|nr:C1 family peptidase [Saprospiraceae bacterium]